MTYNQFLASLLNDDGFVDDQSKEYIRYHARRFYITFNFCKKFLKRGDKVLSIGAWLGSIEKMLVRELGVEVTVMDLPDALDMWKDYYQHMGFKMVKADATNNVYDLPQNHYDMLLYSEIMEHLPKSPSEQLKSFIPFIAPGGHIIVTTPNFASIFTIARLLLMQPVLPVPEKTFGPVNFENQGVHRREYLPCEVKDAMAQSGLTYVGKTYFHYTYPKKIGQRTLYAVGSVIPRFKQGMMLAARK